MEVDWEEQWALFAPNFYNGLARIDLSGRSLLLKPGPGFGDFSHPTTRLCLKFLQQYITPASTVLDIGCGSGILTLASSLLGASYAHGIDIDQEALFHAKKNQEINQIANVNFSLNVPDFLDPNLIVMNMIHSEQKMAWKYSFLNSYKIISGILQTQKEEYLKTTASWGWTLLSESSESSWCAFLFK